MTFSSQPVTFEERRDWVRLARVDTVGPVTFRDLIQRFGTAAAALDALPRLARRGGRGQSLQAPPLDVIEAEFERAHALNARHITCREPDFPARLRHIDPPPPLIIVRGPGRLETPVSVAMVGARSASAIGRRFAHDLARELGAHGVLVVSGLARGVDAAAHDGALATGTVAVVAGGIDIIYPPEHDQLYARISETGAIVSERRFGLRPTAQDFPRRNRLISGLADGVVVVEASRKSGSLITARYAGEQGRDVMAVPGHPADPRAAGANHLLKQGAALVESAEDVLAVIGQASMPFGAGALDGDPSGFTDDAEWSDGPRDGLDLDEEADAVRERVLALLSASPAHRDEIIRAAQAPAASVTAALLELELAGFAVQMDAGYVSLRLR